MNTLIEKTKAKLNLLQQTKKTCFNFTVKHLSQNHLTKQSFILIIFVVYLLHNIELTH